MMNNLWDLIVRPIMESIRPKVIVEIGVASGLNTRNILECFGSSAVLHAVDPNPREEVDSLAKEHIGILNLHVDTSVKVIPRLPEFDAGIIDGDHNWYTVYHELKLIAELHQNDARRFPVLLLHDVHWPYGRRDLYYDPQRIPAEFRQESAQLGIRWGEAGLVEDGGLNRHLNHAVREGGLRNGVMTAVEDFVADSAIEFDFIVIPAFFGLGILVSKSKKSACSELDQCLRSLTSARGLTRIMEALEGDRARAYARIQELNLEIEQHGAEPVFREERSTNVSRDGMAGRGENRSVSLSVVVVVYNMRREATRSLHSLSRSYQRNTEELDYEVIVVDNGSDEPLGANFIDQFGENFSYLYLEDAPPSPASAINIGVEQARGDVVAIMIDGAHILTPGILYYAMKAFNLYENPVVAPRYWFTGPGQQGETVRDGYGPEDEDRLFNRIGWPEDGYRMFEIGEFIGPGSNWMSGFFESNCIFMHQSIFRAIGGADERFDYPGGGFLNLDIMREAAENQQTTLVTLLGEATFHQIHGGITTNVPPELREQRVAMYRKQYREIRGREHQVPNQRVEVLGHRPDIGRHQFAFKNL